MNETLQIDKSYVLGRINDLKQHPIFQEYLYLVQLIKAQDAPVEKPKNEDK